MPYKKVEKKCPWCKEVKKYRKNKKYCSQKCYDNYRASKTEIRNCFNCDKEFKVYLNQIKKAWGRGIYCSKECYWKGDKTEKYKKSKKQMGRKMRGENHPNWQGGIDTGRKARNRKEYKQWRRKVFERDNYTCQDCGIKNKEGLGRSVKMEAHHIKSWSEYPELRYEVDNGLTLCQKCHYKKKGE